MWKSMLLQGLIALLPVFLFLVWYDRSARTRRVPLFFALACGIAILLMSLQLCQLGAIGFRSDFRLVPLLLGSLYGGLPAAVILGSLFGIGLLAQTEGGWNTVAAAAFLFFLLLPLFRVSSAFPHYGQTAKLRIVLLFCCGPLLFAGVYVLIRHLAFAYAPQPENWNFLLLNWICWSAVAVAGEHLVELGFERVKLQGELREMSQKYRREAKRLQLFIDQAPLAVIFADADGCITHVNDVCLGYLHPVSRQSIIGRHCSELPDPIRFDASSLFERVRKGEKHVIEIVRFKGKTFYTVTAVLKEAAGQPPSGYLFIGHDMTELQALKDELGRMERLSLVGQMAASITHEIRNPMAVIRGFIQLLNERSPADQRSYFQIIMEELDRANGIINDFLSLAQNRIVEKRLCSLHDVLNELTPLIWADANMRGQMVDFRLCEKMEPIELNSKEIKQLVLNLVRNGMEAMGDKGVLTIETVNLADIVQLRVSDRGVGIPPERLERLFEPFFTTKTNGTGLGLALCFSTVERHNGKIDVESSVGRGTTFIVSFRKPGREWDKSDRAADRGSPPWQG